MRAAMILGAGCAVLMLTGQAMAEQPTGSAPQKTSAEHPDSDGSNPKNAPMQKAGSTGEQTPGGPEKMSK